MRVLRTMTDLSFEPRWSVGTLLLAASLGRNGFFVSKDLWGILATLQITEQHHWLTLNF